MAEEKVGHISGVRSIRWYFYWLRVFNQIRRALFRGRYVPYA